MAKKPFRRSLKELLSRVLPRSYKLRYLSLVPEFGYWNKIHHSAQKQVPGRPELYALIADSMGRSLPLDYLEFGVWVGGTMRAWLALNNHADSRFFGFDTFEGLPESWQGFSGGEQKGSFSASGKAPDIDDPRLTWVRGLFQDSLPKFLAEYVPQKNIVIHIDSDLYSSALYVLTQCNHILKPGSVVIFDEFSALMDEFRALDDYCSAYYRRYKVLGVTEPHCEQAAILFEN